MSKKHYIKLAACLNQTKPIRDDSRKGVEVMLYAQSATQWQKDVEAVADVCASDNGNFNRARFLAACGLEVRPVKTTFPAVRVITA